MNDAPHALIAGAGIGGLAAALFLGRAGFRVSLLERAKLMDEVGAGLQLAPNATAPLRALGVLPRLLDAALAPHALNIRRACDGALLQRLPLKDAEARWGAPYLLVHRADLQRALVETVAENPAISLAMQTELAGFVTTAKGVEIAARRGASELALAADCLIGADGVRSLTRPKLADLAPDARDTASLPNAAKFVAWRTLVDARDVAPELRRPESTLWLGPEAHLVHYPLRNASVINVVAVVAAPVAIDWRADLWAQRGESTEIAAVFSKWHEDVRAVVGAAQSWLKWPLANLDPLPAWSHGRVTLIGDAAHPMLPFLAQGAAQAIEDAAMLGRLLKPRQSIEAALAAYDAARRPRANRVQRASRRQAHIYHAAGPVALTRDIALRCASANRLLAGYDWLYRPRSYGP